MRNILCMAMLLVIFTGCYKEPQSDVVNFAPALKPQPCTDCIIEGYLISSETKQALAGKEVALTLSVGNYKEADSSLITDGNGYFRFRYNSNSVDGQLGIYPRPVSYSSLNVNDLCIMGELPRAQNLSLGKIYTNASFK